MTGEAPADVDGRWAWIAARALEVAWLLRPGDPHAARDLSQTAVERMLRHRERLRDLGTAQLRAYVRKAVLSAVIDLERRIQRRPQEEPLSAPNRPTRERPAGTLEELVADRLTGSEGRRRDPSTVRGRDHAPPSPDTPEAVLTAHDDDEALIVLVRDGLPRGLAEVVLLHHWHGLNSREIATLLGISQTAVTSRLSRAHRRLRALLGDELSAGDARAVTARGHGASETLDVMDSNRDVEHGEHG